MGWEQDVETAVAAATDAAADAVVTIGRGSGMVVADGRVVTNAHNLRGDEVHVRFADGHVGLGTVAGADLRGDLAVVEVDTAGATPVERLDGDVRLGQPVVALARPRHRGLVATVGTVATLDARFRGPGGSLVTGAFEHDARLPRGASGGPVLDTTGRLLGIDTHRRRDGFYVAISATSELARRLDGLADGEVPRRARLGVAVAPPHVARRLRAAVGLPEREGVLVREVEEGGPADRAGIAGGDLLVAVDGAALESVDDLHAALAGATGSLELTVVRGTDERTVTVEVLDDAA
jgi:serine protease Do